MFGVSGLSGTNIIKHCLYPGRTPEWWNFRQPGLAKDPRFPGPLPRAWAVRTRLVSCCPLWSCKLWEGQVGISELIRSSQAPGEAGWGHPGRTGAGESQGGKATESAGTQLRREHLICPPESRQGHTRRLRTGQLLGKLVSLLSLLTVRQGSTIELRMHRGCSCPRDTLASGPRGRAWLMAQNGAPGPASPHPLSVLAPLWLPRLHLWPPRGGASQTVLPAVSYHSFLPRRAALLPYPSPGSLDKSPPCCLLLGPDTLWGVTI